MRIGKKIRNLRLKKGLTQEELGERTDLSKGYISQIENDLSSPSIDTFFAILEVLGCTPKEFFDEEEDEQKVVYGEVIKPSTWMRKWVTKSNGLYRNPMKTIWNRSSLPWKKTAISRSLNLH